MLDAVMEEEEEEEIEAQSIDNTNLNDSNFEVRCLKLPLVLG